MYCVTFLLIPISICSLGLATTENYFEQNYPPPTPLPRVVMVCKYYPARWNTKPVFTNISQLHTITDFGGGGGVAKILPRSKLKWGSGKMLHRYMHWEKEVDENVWKFNFVMVRWTLCIFSDPTLEPVGVDVKPKEIEEKVKVKKDKWTRDPNLPFTFL